MGIFRPKVDTGPSPAEIAAEEKKARDKKKQATREGVIADRSRVSRSSLTRNPGLFIPGGS